MALYRSHSTEHDNLVEIEDAQDNYRIIFSDLSNRLERLKSNLGKCINKAKPFYEAQEHKQIIQNQIQTVVSRYAELNVQLSNLHNKLDFLETSLARDSKEPSLLEQLNDVTIKLTAKNSEFLEAKKEHEFLLASHVQLEKSLLEMQRKNSNSIRRASSYFNAQSQYNQMVELSKQRVSLAEEKVSVCKSVYTNAMNRLELLSNAIHRDRAQSVVTTTSFSHVVGQQASGSVNLTPLCSRPNRLALSSSPPPSKPTLASCPALYPNRRRNRIASEPSNYTLVGSVVQKIHNASEEIDACNIEHLNLEPLEKLIKLPSSDSGIGSQTVSNAVSRLPSDQSHETIYSSSSSSDSDTGFGRPNHNNSIECDAANNTSFNSQS